MTLRRALTTLLVTFLATTGLAACGGKHTDTDKSDTAFNQFVIELVQQTNDSDEPVNINNQTFEFANDDENVFDSLF